jgi:hypothetical protein
MPLTPSLSLANLSHGQGKSWGIRVTGVRRLLESDSVKARARAGQARAAQPSEAADGADSEPAARGRPWSHLCRKGDGAGSASLRVTVTVTATVLVVTVPVLLTLMILHVRHSPLL